MEQIIIERRIKNKHMAKIARFDVTHSRPRSRITKYIRLITTRNEREKHSNLNKRIIKVPNRVSIHTQLTLRIPITHELKAILRAILNFIVLIPYILKHLKVMQPASRIDGRHGPMDLALLEPRPACARPHQPLHELVRVRVQVVGRFLLWLKGLDVFGLQFVDHLE